MEEGEINQGNSLKDRHIDKKEKGNKLTITTNVDIKDRGQGNIDDAKKALILPLKALLIKDLDGNNALLVDNSIKG